MDTSHRRTADLPLAVWPSAQTTSQWQRHGRYLPASHRHPAKMLPALARRAIETYSDPGELVLDPMCGIGTTLVEACLLGRRAIGVELEPRWAKLAEGNLKHTHRLAARSRAKVIEGDARRLPRLLSVHGGAPLSGSAREQQQVRRMAYGAVDLILTSPPYACNIAELAFENLDSGTGPLRREDTNNYGPDRANLGHARGGAYLAAMAEVYRGCAAVLRPGGYLVVVTKDTATNAGIRDLSGATVALCQDAGLTYWQRVISLLATIRGGELVMRPSFWQTLHARRRRALGLRALVVAHEDVLVFRKPTGTAAARSNPAPPARGGEGR
jgi:modification methylase